MAAVAVSGVVFRDLPGFFFASRWLVCLLNKVEYKFSSSS
jgi:hypothetical protein